MHVFGLTGGIATGKSTVAARWRQRGLPVVDADVLARLVVSPGSDALVEIARLLGTGVLLDDGSLNRAVVAAKVFEEPVARRALEAIVHPRVHLALQAELELLRKRGNLIACYEAPLLIEVGSQETYRPLVVVSSTPELQLRRAEQRDGTSAAALQARVAAQLPLAEKEATADYVILNNGSRQALLRQADHVLDSVCRRLGMSADILTQL
jgi:dephospho-CoA kinase